jgi:hypothetical protein
MVFGIMNFKNFELILHNIMDSNVIFDTIMNGGYVEPTREWLYMRSGNFTPLDVAAFYGRLDYIEPLVNIGFSIDATAGRRSALECAIITLKIPIIHKLLSYELSPMTQSDSLILVIDLGLVNLCTILLDHGVTIGHEHIERAVMRKDIVVISFLISHGAPISSCTNLIILCAMNRIPSNIINLLLDSGMSTYKLTYPPGNRMIDSFPRDIIPKLLEHIDMSLGRGDTPK